MSRLLTAPIAALALAVTAGPATAANVVEDSQIVRGDQVVQGSQCVGIDCSDTESYAFDTFRLKENNTRIKFEDTSTSAGYSGNDWQLTANENGPTGASKFSIEDITGLKTPFTLRAGAPDDSLFVSPIGDIGLGTGSPLLDLHISRGDTPAMRFEQTAAGGFTAQTWDVGANEANFFVRDLTGGSRLTFRIRPGAPTSSIDIKSNGDVGMGTASAASPLHVQRADGSSQLRVEEKSGTATDRVLADLVNNGPARARYASTVPGTTAWLTGNGTANEFVVKPDGGADALTVAPSGDVRSRGALESSADPADTEAPEAVSPQTVLNGVKQLDVKTWEYKDDPQNARHIGPTGADFRAAFGVGGSDGFVSAADQAGVALVSIKRLAADDAALGTRIDGVAGSVTALETSSNGKIADVADDLAALDTSTDSRMDGIAARVKTLEDEPAPDFSAEFAELSGRIKAVEDEPAPDFTQQFSEIGERLKAVEDRPAPSFAQEFKALGDRIAALEGKPGPQDLSPQLAALATADAGQAKRIKTLQKQNRKLGKRLKAIEKKLKKKR